MAGTLGDAVTTPFGTGHHALQARAFVHHDGLDHQVVDIGTFVVFRVGNRRQQNLTHQLSGFLRAEGQNVQSLTNRLTAHEVGNPLTSISSMVQILQRRVEDPYTLDKLALVSGQLLRIQATLRELIEFSRPASSQSLTSRGFSPDGAFSSR